MTEIWASWNTKLWLKLKCLPLKENSWYLKSFEIELPKISLFKDLKTYFKKTAFNVATLKGS